MYKRTSLVVRNDLARRFNGNRSIQTCWGVERAFQFAHAVCALPVHTIESGNALDGSFGPTWSLFLHEVMNEGQRLRTAIESSSRVTVEIGIDVVDNIMVDVRLYQPASRMPTMYITVGFDHVFGSLAWIGYGPRRNPSSDDFWARIERCRYCGTEVSWGGRNWQVDHRQACPHGQPEYTPPVTDWETGYDDAMRMIQTEGPTSPEYTLGSDMGGLAYQAELAAGLRQPV